MERTPGSRDTEGVPVQVQLQRMICCDRKHAAYGGVRQQLQGIGSDAAAAVSLIQGIKVGDGAIVGTLHRCGIAAGAAGAVFIQVVSRDGDGDGDGFLAVFAGIGAAAVGGAGGGGNDRQLLGRFAVARGGENDIGGCAAVVAIKNPPAVGGAACRSGAFRPAMGTGLIRRIGLHFVFRAQSALRIGAVEGFVSRTVDGDILGLGHPVAPAWLCPLGHDEENHIGIAVLHREGGVAIHGLGAAGGYPAAPAALGPCPGIAVKLILWEQVGVGSIDHAGGGTAGGAGAGSIQGMLQFGDGFRVAAAAQGAGVGPHAGGGAGSGGGDYAFVAVVTGASVRPFSACDSGEGVVGPGAVKLQIIGLVDFVAPIRCRSLCQGYENHIGGLYLEDHPAVPVRGLGGWLHPKTIRAIVPVPYGVIVGAGGPVIAGFQIDGGGVCGQRHGHRRFGFCGAVRTGFGFKIAGRTLAGFSVAAGFVMDMGAVQHGCDTVVFCTAFMGAKAFVLHTAAAFVMGGMQADGFRTVTAVVVFVGARRTHHGGSIATPSRMLGMMAAILHSKCLDRHHRADHADCQYQVQNSLLHCTSSHPLL